MHTKPTSKTSVTPACLVFSPDPRPVLSRRLSSFLSFALLAAGTCLAACSSGAGGGTGGASGGGGSTGMSALTYKPCDEAVRVGQFTLELKPAAANAPGYSQVNGSVRDGVDPRTVWQELAKSGDCRVIVGPTSA